MQSHPLTSTVKLNIEMSMAELIANVSRSSNNPCCTAHCRITLVRRAQKHELAHLSLDQGQDRNMLKPKDGWSGSFSSFDVDRSLSRTASNRSEVMVNMKREVQIQVEQRSSITPSLGLKEQKSIAESTRRGTFDDDEDVDREEGEE
jgi:hypothetical protein